MSGDQEDYEQDQEDEENVEQDEEEYVEPPAKRSRSVTATKNVQPSSTSSPAAKESTSETFVQLAQQFRMYKQPSRDESGSSEEVPFSQGPRPLLPKPPFSESLGIPKQSGSPPTPASPAPLTQSADALPFQPPSNTVQQILNTTVGKSRLFLVTLEHIRQSQRHILDLPPLECAVNLEALSRQHKELYDALSLESSMLNRLFDDVILLPAEMFHAKKLLLLLQKYMKQLELYQLELMHYIRPEAIPCPATIVITDQPFSRSIVKGQMVPLEAQLLLPSKIDLKHVGAVEASIAQSSSTPKTKGSKTPYPLLENNTENIDTEGIVRFHLRFNTGTNKKPVTLKLQVNIKHGPLKCHNTALSQTGVRVVESAPSRPFIITTNSIQWRDSEGILLKMEAFCDLTEVSWPRFANTLHSYYLAATRQNTEYPIRPLSLKDFEYLSRLRFNGAASVSLQAYDAFWEWFGSGLEKIRHQKNLCPLWVKGYLYGLISKPEADKLLLGYEDGTFIIRMSDRFAGKYACAYVYEGQVHHSLIRDTDGSGNKRTLVDFLHEIDQVQTILQIHCDFYSNIQITKCSKDEILQEFLSEKVEPSISGYEDFPRKGFRPSTATTAPHPAPSEPPALAPHSANPNA